MKAFNQLLGYLKAYRKFVFLNILCNVLMAIFMVISIPAIIPFFNILFDRAPQIIEKPELSFSTLDVYAKYQFSHLINTYTRADALAIVCLVIVLIFFFKNLFRYLAVFFMAFVRNGIVRDVRKRLYEKYLNLPFSFFGNERKGDLISRITTDVQEIEQSILNVLETTFKEPIVLIGSIGFMLYISPRLTLFVFVLILFTVFIIGGISRTLKKKSHLAQSRLAGLVSIIEESLSGMRIIKGFNAEAHQQKKFNLENDKYRDLITRIMWRRDLSSPLSEFLGITIVAVLLWYGSRQVFSEHIQAETFFAFLFAFYNVINPAKSFSSAYYHIQKGLAAVDRVNAILDLDIRIEETPNAKPLTDFNDRITFRNVSFQYAGSDTNVLNQVDFEVERGQIIALVGASGSGKSTLVDLLPRFHDVSAGSILIDGVDIRHYQLKDLREMIGIVSQEAILFNDTIHGNITFSTEGKTQSEIERAARYAFAHEFIMETEEGYQSVIGDRGSKLSGGQRQRLTIARALLKDPPILILDEATASLDSESEREVQKALEHVMRGRTSIVIAHRLSTIQNADVIYVMKQGEIVESGSHESLLKVRGEYNKFVALQAFS